jgi:hypothetical protein
MTTRLLRVEPDSERTSATRMRIWARYEGCMSHGERPFRFWISEAESKDLWSMKEYLSNPCQYTQASTFMPETAIGSAPIFFRLDEPPTFMSESKIARSATNLGEWEEREGSAAEPYLLSLLQQPPSLQRVVAHRLLTVMDHWQACHLLAEVLRKTAPSSATPSPRLPGTSAQHVEQYNEVVQMVRKLAQEEADARGLTIKKIDVRPAWSHEYDTRSGVVIDVGIKSTAEERFAYWDAVCERIYQLEGALSAEARNYLINDVSFIVSRS